jgi:hypothetical protein
MKMKLFYVVLTGFCLLSYLDSWYAGIMIPAWQAAIWVGAVFIDELNGYLEAKESADWI